jgi:hypothetical protein
VDPSRRVCVLQAFCRLEEETVLRAVLFKPGTNAKSNTVILSTAFSISAQQSASVALGQPQVTSPLSVINAEESGMIVNLLKHSDHYNGTCRAKLDIWARNNRTGVARGVFCVVLLYTLLGDGQQTRIRYKRKCFPWSPCRGQSMLQKSAEMRV